MLMGNLIMIESIVISIVLIIISIRKFKSDVVIERKNITILGIAYLIYLYILNIGIFNFFPFEQSLEIVFSWPIIIVGSLTFVISLLTKPKKKARDVKDIKYNILLTIGLIIPILVVSLPLIYEIHASRSSMFLVECRYDGNGGFGDGGYATYAVDEKYITELSVELWNEYGYRSHKFYSKNHKKLKINELKDLDYKVELNDRSVFVTLYKNDEIVRRSPINSSYFEIDSCDVYINKRK